MAPGSTSLLRARRSGAIFKPNRVLDKSSSRGMIYENEELRLRTININAEVERSQSDIKKLRRENELLRREIWSLRDECDRLEELLKQKDDEDEEDEDEDEEEDQEEDKEIKSEENEEGRRILGRRKSGMLAAVETLSIVPEESEEVSREPSPQMSDNAERQCEVYEGTLPPLLRVNAVHPHTVAATLDSSVLPSITVGEVIDSCWTAQMEGVRLIAGSLFISLKNKRAVEDLLSSGLTIRGTPLPLEDVSQGTVVVAMSGVPHAMSDTALFKVLSQFGPLIGHIERRYYRNVDTGERLARLRLLSPLPKRLYVDGCEVAVRSLPHDELARLATLPSTILRRPLHVKLEGDLSEKSETSQATPISKAHSFSFPTSAHQTPTPTKTEDGDAAATTKSDSEASGVGQKRGRLRQSIRRGHSPSSSSEQESPNKPSRRKMSVRRREDELLLERERSPSLSSRASEVRKMSVTGRESGKLPWFGCWGNGCV